MAETDELKIGDHVETASKEDVTVFSVSLTNVVERTYNLEVAEWHTFMVGRDHVVVHNGCPRDARTVGEVLKTKRGSIKRAPLPPGFPSWDKIMNMTMDEIDARARANEPGFREIRKLLTSNRFGK